MNLVLGRGGRRRGTLRERLRKHASVELLHLKSISMRELGLVQCCVWMGLNLSKRFAELRGGRCGKGLLQLAVLAHRPPSPISAADMFSRGRCPLVVCLRKESRRFLHWHRVDVPRLCYCLPPEMPSSPLDLDIIVD